MSLPRHRSAILAMVVGALVAGSGLASAQRARRSGAEGEKGPNPPQRAAGVLINSKLVASKSDRFSWPSSVCAQSLSLPRYSSTRLGRFPMWIQNNYIHRKPRSFRDDSSTLAGVPSQDLLPLRSSMSCA